MIKIVTGVHPPTSGEVYYKGEKITLHSVKRSRELGIETVYQERALADQQALWRNVFAGRELMHKFGFLKVKQQKQETNALLRAFYGRVFYILRLRGSLLISLTHVNDSLGFGLNFFCRFMHIPLYGIICRCTLLTRYRGLVGYLDS